ncbi:uncharacterized protein LOC113294645 [Papaver somniferum]|uniref:uncharacterized protein LOC113294645 n=1 Tax=Papaver somniferum TaxID=3469 RepID=UPI000E6F74ED|nr:uncharacterized protein LOC113294645 [Papaver somniferum]
MVLMVLFICWSGTIYLLVYVDDIIVTGSNTTGITSILTRLQHEFAIKDLGSLSYFLGIKETRTSSGLFLSQQRYAHDLLIRAKMDGVKPIQTPLSTSGDISFDRSTLLSDATEYRSIVGALQYLTFTRPDLAYVVNKVCQFMHAPTKFHWSLVKRILRYLKHTTNFGILLRPSPSLQLSFGAYTDSDWAGSLDDRCSTFGNTHYACGRVLIQHLVRVHCDPTLYTVISWLPSLFSCIFRNQNQLGKTLP